MAPTDRAAEAHEKSLHRFPGSHRGVRESPAQGWSSPAMLALVGLLGLVGFAALSLALRKACFALGSDECLWFWPVSLFAPVPPTVFRLGLGAIALGFFGSALLLARRSAYPLPVVLGTGVVLVLLTNLMHGWPDGFATVDPEAYYLDVPAVADPLSFVRDFNVLQPTLHLHSETHPPGAVLAYWGLDQVFHDPAWVGVALSVLSVLAGGLAVHALFRREHDARAAATMTLLFLLLPATQVYFGATLDALVCALFAGALAFWLRPGRWNLAGALACLFAASMLTFLAAHLLLVLVAFSLFARRDPVRPLALVGLFGLLHLALLLGTGFDYAAAARAASAAENPLGFRLLVEPVDYLFTRVESVGELAFFLGPFLLVLGVVGWRVTRAAHRDFHVLALASLGVFALMLAAGVFRTGETARAAMYLYPALLMPVATVVARSEERERSLLLGLVFAQALAMQLVGHYMF